jgi:glucokinase
MAGLILGVEIGGTKLQLGAGTSKGKLFEVRKGSVPVDEGGEGIRRWLEMNIPPFLVFAEQRFGSVKGIGVGFGGPINTSAGRVIQSIQIPGWHDFPIRDWFQETFSLPATVDNDSNAAVWGEYNLGFGKGCQHFFYTNLGSGVGGGFVFNGQLFDGQGYGAGEFGHTYVPDWTNKAQRAVEKIENLCSGWSIEARLRQPGYIPRNSELYQQFKDKLASLTAVDLAKFARSGDNFALAEIDHIAHAMGIGLANVLSLTNVERIAIGGGVSKMGELLIGPIRKYVDHYAFVSSKGNYAIQQCALGDQIVLAGAILIASERLKIA